jgi:type I restriction enzyme S subunit
MSICATIGCPIMVDMPACIHDGFVHFYDINGAETEFLYYALQYAEDEFVKMGQQGTQANLNTTLVGNHIIFVPPVSKQRKIAKILMSVDNLIEKTEVLIAKYQAIKQGMMHDLFTRGVDKHGHLRPTYDEAPALYKPSALGWIPKEWEVCRVDEVGTVQLGRQRSPKYQTGRFIAPYLRVANIFDGWIDCADILDMDFTSSERETYSVLPGYIFLNEGQSLELVGRSAIYEGKPGQYCFQNTLIRFRTYPPNYFRYCRGVFKHWLDTGRFTTVARQTTSVAHPGAERFAAMLFPHPTPEEQLRISKVLQEQEDQISAKQQHINKLSKIKAGLMQDLLTGKVRVKVDVSDETPA